MADETGSWGLEEGDEIAPGRSVVRDLGGGRRFEVMLVWDERLFALTVAKVLRPRYAESERALRELGEEARALELPAPSRDRPRLRRGARRAATRTCCSSTSRDRRCGR